MQPLTVAAIGSHSKSKLRRRQTATPGFLPPSRRAHSCRKPSRAFTWPRGKGRAVRVCMVSVPVPYSSVTWLGVREGVKGGVREGGARGSLAASLFSGDQRLPRSSRDLAELSPRSRRDLAELSPRSSRALAELSPRSRLGRLVVAAHKEDSAWVGRLATAVRCAMMMTHVMEVRPREGGP